MLRQLSTPLRVLLAGLIIIVLVIAGADARPQNTPRAALAYDYPASDATNTPTPTATATTATAATATATAATAATLTPTLIVAPTVGNTTPTLVPTTAAVTPLSTATPLFSPTPTLTPLPDTELTCIPGQPVDVTGQGPPNVGLLMYFNQRAVGGGSVGMDGKFALTLVVGAERPGRYPVEVQNRGTRQVLRALDCIVPSVTSTATVTPP